MAGDGSRSRDGCMDCRRRKRGCDKAKPVCSSCRKHRVACIYNKPNQTSPSKYFVSVAGEHFILPLESAVNHSFVNLRSDEIGVVCGQYAEQAIHTAPPPTDQNQHTAPSKNHMPLVRNPCWLPIPEKVQSVHETLLVQYYFEVISNSKVYVDTERNIFRTSVMPVLLSNHGSLFSTVLALTAAEWGRRGLSDGIDYTAAALQYKVTALKQLQSNLNGTSNAEESLLTCVLQASLEISEGSRPSWLRHLRGALAIMDTHSDWISPDCAALALQYFRFRYVLLKTTKHGSLVQNGDGTCQADPVECNHDAGALDKALSILGNPQSVDPQLGCSMELVELIRMTSTISPAQADVTTPSTTCEDGILLEKRIRQLKFDAMDDYLIKSAECFRLSALIYLRLVLFNEPIRYPSISTLLQRMIDHLSEIIVEDQPRRSFPMWPLFIAGCVSHTDANRKVVLDLFNLLDSKWPISNISTVMKVVWTIWQTRDFDSGLEATVHHDWQEIIEKFGWKLSLS
ncbi:uncharacterized protein CTRU02_201590 [Colletotrichum truncatum]|uniref:Uncharacterized protein n=1 Tax=Colletotrichum truncatum TaxID=5467 RepID=A0ACC3ZHS9_COLTU|nr:uncharacterized protein CTRU02_10818 [Colletotrichum truncatum]KAF6786694.1 hypothetical protein CTRU02_10818 [Colletotrichum truncatum]